MVSMNEIQKSDSRLSSVQIYLQRLNVDLSNGETVRLAAGCAFALATQALAELPILQFPPSLTAAAVLVAARKAQASPSIVPSPSLPCFAHEQSMPSCACSQSPHQPCELVS